MSQARGGADLGAAAARNPPATPGHAPAAARTVWLSSNTTGQETAWKQPPGPWTHLPSKRKRAYVPYTNSGRTAREPLSPRRRATSATVPCPCLSRDAGAREPSAAPAAPDPQFQGCSRDLSPAPRQRRSRVFHGGDAGPEK